MTEQASASEHVFELLGEVAATLRAEHGAREPGIALESTEALLRAATAVRSATASSAAPRVSSEAGIGAPTMPQRPISVPATGLPRENRSAERNDAGRPQAQVSAAAGPPPWARIPTPTLEIGVGSEELRAIRNEIGDCTRCNLCDRRKNLVFGTGNPSARLMFIGEAPGSEEDQQGEPFVGPAGQLLTKMIDAMGMSRADVYIANVVKCRPPNNRDPAPDEIAKCLPFLRMQVEAIRPEVIVSLGRIAPSALLGREVKITAERGTWTKFGEVPMMLTYHPAYLLRQTDRNAKAQTWSDLQLVMQRLELPVPPPRRG